MDANVDANEPGDGIRAAGVVLRLGLWIAPAHRMLPAPGDEQSLAWLLTRRFVERVGRDLALTANGTDWMITMEQYAYCGLGVWLGMPNRSVAAPAGERCGQVTLTILDGDLSFLLDLLITTLPSVGARGYERHRAMKEVVHAHLADAVYALVDGVESHDKTGYIRFAQMFGLVPYAPVTSE